MRIPKLVCGAGFSMATLMGTGGALAATTTLQLDFTQTGGPYTTGWVPVYGNFLADTPTASVSDINSTNYSFSIDHVGCYDDGNAGESLTRSGFYTFNNDASDHDFTLTGLNPGDSVALYACAAWDGNGRGGVIIFGSSGPTGVEAQTLGDPGTSPTLANFTDIGTEVADITGAVTGSLTGSGGAGTGTEGQLGGVEFVITTAVPEPASVCGAALGAAGLLVRRRRGC